ncbi:hypothetical protein SHDE107825_19290 [Shewanella denitrificans]
MYRITATAHATLAAHGHIVRIEIGGDHRTVFLLITGGLFPLGIGQYRGIVTIAWAIITYVTDTYTIEVKVIMLLSVPWGFFVTD